MPIGDPLFENAHGTDAGFPVAGHMNTEIRRHWRSLQDLGSTAKSQEQNP